MPSSGDPPVTRARVARHNAAAAAAAGNNQSTTTTAANPSTTTTARPTPDNSPHTNHHATNYNETTTTTDTSGSPPIELTKTQAELLAVVAGLSLIGVLFLSLLYLATLAAPFIWLWRVHQTGTLPTIMKLIGLFFYCCWVSSPVQDLLRQWRERAAREPAVLLPYVACLAAPFVWL